MIEQDEDRANAHDDENEDSRPARAGETGTTRFGQSEGSDTDGAGSPGTVDEPAIGPSVGPTTHFSEHGGQDTDGAGSGGILSDEPAGGG